MPNPLEDKLSNIDRLEQEILRRLAAAFPSAATCT